MLLVRLVTNVTQHQLPASFLHFIHSLGLGVLVFLVFIIIRQRTCEDRKINDEEGRVES